METDFESLYPMSRKISRFVGEAVKDYGMIREGDDILIGLSGGKDSLLLALALSLLRKRSPVNFSLSACLIDQSGGEMETQGLVDFMRTLGVPFSVIEHPTYRIMKEREERSPCSLCANIRRGVLASVAKETAHNVIALGHHKDDAAETVLMNLLYGGRFKCFHPHLYMSRTGVRVIRPFIYIEERRIALEARRLALPVASSCCPFGEETKRSDAKRKIAGLEASCPDLKSNILHALANIAENESWKKKGMLNE